MKRSLSSKYYETITTCHCQDGFFYAIPELNGGSGRDLEDMYESASYPYHTFPYGRLERNTGIYRVCFKKFIGLQLLGTGEILNEKLEVIR